MSWWVNLFGDLLVAGAIVAVAYGVAGWAARAVRDYADDFPELDEALFGFLASLARYAVLALAAIFVLGRFGIETTVLVALVAAAGLALALALQGTLGSLIAGLVLLALRPFKVGDEIEAGGQSGTVAAIGLFTTEVTRADNAQVLVPNGQIWAGAITNFSHHEARRLDLSVAVPQGADLRVVEEALRDAIDTEARIHDAPEPIVKLEVLDQEAVTFAVRVWCDREEHGMLGPDLIAALSARLGEAGITATAIRRAP